MVKVFLKVCRLVFVLAVVILGVVFACLNAQMVDVNLLLASVRLPLSVVTVFALGFGVVFGQIGRVMSRFTRTTTRSSRKS